MSQSQIARTIEIVRIPHGDAPEWVRRAWIGCRFPTASFECDHVAQLAHSVLPKQSRKGLLKASEYMAMPEEERNSAFGQSIAGYNVLQGVALKTLADISPAAHIYWKSLGFPKDDPDENCFRFKKEECKVLEFYSYEELAELKQ